VTTHDDAGSRRVPARGTSEVSSSPGAAVETPTVLPGGAGPVPGPAIGSHVAVAGGLVRVGLREAEDIAAETVQIFATNPRAWRPSPVVPAVDALFRDTCGALGLPVFVHASYLINLGSPSLETRERSAAFLLHTLRRASELGARGVVVHAGTAVVPGRRDAALATLHDLIGRLLDEAPDQVRLLIEPTAGGGEALASTVDGTAEYLAAVDDERVGVCVDTCHLHASGESIDTAAGMRSTMTRLVNAIGAHRVGLIHVNDSRDESGSRRDRHETLGSGRIGPDAFRGLFSVPALQRVPLVVETPTHRQDVDFLKALRADLAAVASPGIPSHISSPATPS